MRKLVCIGGGEIPRYKNGKVLPYETKEIDEERHIKLTGKSNKNTLKTRIKHAFQILFKKPVYYADIIVTEKRMRDFLVKLNDSFTSSLIAKQTSETPGVYAIERSSLLSTFTRGFISIFPRHFLCAINDFSL